MRRLDTVTTTTEGSTITESFILSAALSRVEVVAVSGRWSERSASLCPRGAEVGGNVNEMDVEAAIKDLSPDQKNALASALGIDVTVDAPIVREADDGFLVEHNGTLHGKGGTTGEDADPYANEAWAKRRASELAGSITSDNTEEEAATDLPVLATVGDLEGVDLPDWARPVAYETRDNDHGNVMDVGFVVEDSNGQFHGKSGSGPTDDPTSDELRPYWSFRGASYNRHAGIDDPGRDNPVDRALRKYADGERPIQ